MREWLRVEFDGSRASRKEQSNVSHIIFSSLCGVGWLRKGENHKASLRKSTQSIKPNLAYVAKIRDFQCICHRCCFLESNHVKSADTEKSCKIEKDMTDVGSLRAFSTWIGLLCNLSKRTSRPPLLFCFSSICITLLHTEQVHLWLCA